MEWATIPPVGQLPTPRDRLTTAEFVGGAPVAPRESPASHFRDRYMNIMRR